MKEPPPPVRKRTMLIIARMLCISVDGQQPNMVTAVSLVMYCPMKLWLESNQETRLKKQGRKRLCETDWTNIVFWMSKIKDS